MQIQNWQLVPRTTNIRHTSKGIPRALPDLIFVRVDREYMQLEHLSRDPSDDAFSNELVVV